MIKIHPTLLALVIFLGAWPTTAAEPRPNLLFIYLDDFGWKDTGFMGSDFYETPNLDRLAAAGMIFTDAYANAANCAPSRASLMSGQYTPRHRIFTVGTRPRGESAHRRLIPSETVDVLDPEIITWAHLMQAAGYRTATMGKWHLSGDPLPYGFDLNIGGTHSGGPPRGYYPPHPKAPGLAEVGADEYLTDTLSERAVEFIRANQQQPWGLYLTHFAVHTPLDAKKQLLEKYRAKEPGDLHNHVVMATMIEAVDQGVGKIMGELEQTGQTDRTIIVFTSDNGGYGPATSMAPLRGYKGTYYEGGIRVPMFVTWPGVVEPGGTCGVPVIGTDFYPTFCEMLGLDLPEGQVLDGVSLVPLLRSGADVDIPLLPKAREELLPLLQRGADYAEFSGRPLFWHFPRYLQSYPGVDGLLSNQRDPLFRTRPVSVVRHGPWKLIQYFEDGMLELFNLDEDIGEQNNLVEEHPAQARELLVTLQQWQQDIGAPIPTEPNPEFDPQAERKAIEALKGDW